MKKDEAKDSSFRSGTIGRQNLPPGQRASGTDGLIFFGYLQMPHPYLVELKASGDRWQTVHGWLSRESKITRTMPA
jgi:hypothetical protein